MSRSLLPPLNALRAFEATARLGGVGRAAQDLHVTHGAVSRQLKLLEDHLGLALFQRAGRGLRLTAAGTRLQAACSDAFGGIEDCVRELRRPAAAPALVLGCSGSVLARWMIPRLPALQAALPGVRLQWSALDGSFTEAQAALDAVLLLAQGPWPRGWQVRELAPERVGVVVAPSHPAAQRLRHVPPSALLQETLLHTSSRPQAWPAWAQAQGLDVSKLQLGTAFEHLYYLLEAAVAGLGPAIAPEPLVAEDLAAGRLIAPWGFAATGGFWVLARPDGPADARVDAVADWVAAQLR
ncbi:MULTISPECIES: LysR family transcriptional regulator [Stenotrophomonas]|jgi:DNA-binding transcriptional LysR family regulator|uniref:LysR family transcriptional regulator n=3 Tax=Gammaproteobacteria TaxID=1236 RepID=A0A246L168_9GAMM|nr:MULTISPECIES: LysR family transcriptional regulator [Stenotrophomonas]MBC9078080.1 LysR family transcriptional regulator [Stenotrophomonas maltophilia]MBC9091926.1 LysR family transcriptional regulator [Stenotrophomonas maltophilia]MBH1387357.1 LysR family transcriptional regulator [Stenotrophomonas maltophilia]MBH1519601.1 LysR family transcriptional regulator [Stenotrophomonas maltophilia]MBN4940358.1 LysR family transcriptional regulator [Stenotrophomonas maltophilia]